MYNQFSNLEIQLILDQSAAYNCICLAQVARSITEQRALYQYQMACLEKDETDRNVHEQIAATVTETHRLLEKCLEKILNLEGWDLETMTMPPALVKKYIQNYNQSE